MVVRVVSNDRLLFFYFDRFDLYIIKNCAFDDDSNIIHIPVLVLLEIHRIEL